MYYTRVSYGTPLAQRASYLALHSSLFGPVTQLVLSLTALTTCITTLKFEKLDIHCPIDINKSGHYCQTKIALLFLCQTINLSFYFLSL